MNLDANKVVNSLLRQVGEQAAQIAMLRAQIEVMGGEDNGDIVQADELHERADDSGEAGTTSK
jgi:hypothetical protein